MQYPVVVLAGKAGSGKDTVAAQIVQEYGAVAISFSDPMKRFMSKVFRMPDELLWGPSEERGKKFLVTRESWENAKEVAGYIPARKILVDIGLPDPIANAGYLTASKYGEFMGLYSNWWEDMERHINNGTFSARVALQSFGTDVGRAYKDTIWVDYALRTSRELLTNGGQYSRDKGITPDPFNKLPSMVVIVDGRFRNEILGVKAHGGAAVKIFRPDDSSLASDAKAHVSEVQQDGIPVWWYDQSIYNDGSLEDLAFKTRNVIDKLQFPSYL